MLNAYPEGEYQVRAHTVSDQDLWGAAELSHHLLPAPTFALAAGERVDPNTDLVVTWKTVAGAESYTIEIEQDDLDVNITARLEANTRSFTVPAGFLVPGVKYEIGIAAEAQNGNLSVAESSFETYTP